MLLAPVPARRLLLAFLLGLACETRATIFTSGDVSPTYTGGSSWFTGNLTVGSTAFGYVSANGGSHIDSFEAYLGDRTSGGGRVDISGFNTEWDLSRDLYLGVEGNGELDINLQGLVTGRDAYVGDRSTGTGSALVQSGGRWELTGSMSLGVNGAGSLEVLSGGYASAHSLYLGEETGSQGGLRVNGLGSRVEVQNSLQHSGDGRASLQIENFGVVQVDGATRLGDAATQITFSGNGALNTGELLAAPESLKGVGSISTGGLVSDVDLVFDASTGLQPQLVVTNGGADNVVVDLDPTVARRSLGVGYLGTGSLTIRDGLNVPTNSGYLGFFAGSEGSAVVSGPSSTWDVQNPLFIGLFGSGSLRVEDRATVSAYSMGIGELANSHGEVLVTGSGTTVQVQDSVAIGSSTDSSLRVESGASLTARTAVLGIDSSSGRSTMVVDGAGATVEATEGLFVGFQSDGELEITNGALVTSDGVVSVSADTDSHIRFDFAFLRAGGLAAAAQDLHGVGLIDTKGLATDVDLVFDASHDYQQQVVLDALPGQNITISLDVLSNVPLLGAGISGSGSLRIADGRSVASDFGVLGEGVGSTALGKVEGPGSRWDAGQLTIANTGDASLHVTGGAVVTGSRITSSASAGSQSEVLVEGAGSRLEADDRLIVGSQSDSTLTVSDGGVVRSPTISLGQIEGVTVQGEGSLLEATTGSFIFSRSSNADFFVLDQGLVKANQFSGIGTSTQFLMHSGGRLAVLGDRDGGLFFFLSQLTSMPSPRFWDGTDWVDINSGQPGVDYTLEYQTSGEFAGFTILTVGETVALPGDYNDDGVVDAADYTVWRDNLDLPSTLPGDIHGGIVGQAQYATWATNFGKSAPALSVPEPLSLWLVFSLLVLKRDPRGHLIVARTL